MPFVTNAGVKIHYESQGSGPAVVFHTGAGGDLRIWQQAGYLDGLSGFRKILIDQRGRGESDRPSSVEAHRLEWFVSDLEKVLDAVGVRSTAFWGYSNGTYVGVAFGAAHPDRLWALVGTGSLSYRNFDETPRTQTPEQIINEDVAAGGVRAEVAARMRDENDQFPKEIHDNVVAGDSRMHALDGVAWLDWHGPLAVYPRIQMPVLMLAGENEDPNRVTEKSVAALADARLVRFPGLGHLGSFYRSDVALPHARPFLEAAAARAHLG
jgi:pimeloyl-ACP methyl ester carboxylesterase